MRKLLFIILLLASGQIMAQSYEYYKPDARLYYFWDGTDTIAESIDTIDRELPFVLEGALWKIYCSMTADSLSGDQTGAAYLQASYKYDPETWFDLDTLTFIGAGTYTSTYTHLTSTPFMPLKLRLWCASADTLGTTRLTEAWILLKR